MVYIVSMFPNFVQKYLEFPLFIFLFSGFLLMECDINFLIISHYDPFKKTI